MSQKTYTPDQAILKHGRTRSFGRVASRLTAAEQHVMDAKLKPYCIELTEKDGAVVPGQLDAKTLWPQAQRVIVEIGLGKGEWFTARATSHADWAFVGCEVFKNGLEQITKVIDKNGLQNVKLFAKDGRDLLLALKPGSVDEIVFLYPDPWPKKKHNKRRIIQAETLAMIARALKPDGQLFIATDITDYAYWILREVLNEGSFVAAAAYPQEMATAPADWVSTGYEQKARKAGRGSWYFTFVKKP